MNDQSIVEQEVPVSGRVEIFRSARNDEYYFRVLASNGKVVAQSEGYSRKNKCVEGVQALQKAMVSPKIVDLCPDRRKA